MSFDKIFDLTGDVFFIHLFRKNTSTLSPMNHPIHVDDFSKYRNAQVPVVATGVLSFAILFSQQSEGV